MVPDMPHVPDLRSHETHDLELVAAHAAGDTAGRDLVTADALLAACLACAELHADLRAIAAATPAVPARPRTRDYRLTPEQARALRPTGWRRVLAAFAAPKLAFTAPLGSGLAALGIAGLLLTSVPGVLPGTAMDGSAPAFAPQASELPAKVENLAPGASPDVAALGGQTAAPRDLTGQAAPGDATVTSSPAGEAPWAMISGALLAAGLLLLGVNLFARRFAPGR